MHQVQEQDLPFLTHSSDGFDSLSFSEVYSYVLEDTLDVITRRLEIIFLYITTQTHRIRRM